MDRRLGLDRAEMTKEHNVPLPGVPFTSYPLRPLREVLGLFPPTTEPLKYTMKEQVPNMKRKRRTRRKRKKKGTPAVICIESAEEKRSTVTVARFPDNEQGETTSSSTLSPPPQDKLHPIEPRDDVMGDVERETTCSSLFSHPYQDKQTVQARDNVMDDLEGGTTCSISHPHQDKLSSVRAQDNVNHRNPSNGAAPPVSSNDMGPRVQSNDISSCSEIEALLGMSQPRKKARKRRRVASKLSLSQSSIRHKGQSLRTEEEEVQFLKEVVHSSLSSSSTSSTSSSINISHTNEDCTNAIDPSRCMDKQDSPTRSESVFVSFVQTGVGVDQPTQSLKQTLPSSHRKTQTSSYTAGKHAQDNIVLPNSSVRQHMNSRCYSDQTPLPPVVHSSHKHRECQMSNFTKPKDVTLTTSDESDLSVYYEARSHLTILEESCPGPSGVIRDSECPGMSQSVLKCPSGEAVQAGRQKGDADTSSDYTPHSFSSSGSSTFVSVPNNTVLTNEKHPTTTSTRTLDNTLVKYCQTNQREVGRGHSVLFPQLRTNQENPSVIRSEGKTRPIGLSMGLTGRSTNRTPRGENIEVSSSTSDCNSEEDPSSQHQQVLREANMKVDRKLSSSHVSSSSSSSDSVLLTQAGKGCIQTIGEVFKHFFGGTVEDNLTLLQRNNFNLLKSLVELQTASSSSSQSCLHSAPRPHSP